MKILAPLVIGSAVFAFVFFVLFSYAKHGYHQASINNDPPSETTTDAWKTYYNEKYGFSVEIPSSWEPSTDKFPYNSVGIIIGN